MNEIQIPPELLNTPVQEWQLNGVTVVLAIMLLGRLYSAIRKGGGLRGLWRGLVFGENVPKE
jgi:hypothetical protein